MKNKILVGITTSFLLVNSLNATILDDAINAYNQKSYEDAFNYFETFLKEGTSNKRINFMYGRSAYELGNYEEALRAYGKVLLEDPKSVRSRLEIAQSYYRLKMYDKALEQFELVLKEDIPNSVRKNVEFSILNINQKSKKHFFRAMAMLGFGYDSNINNDANSGEYTIYVPAIDTNLDLSNDGEKESDSFMQFVLSSNYNYKINDGLVLENKLAFNTQRYFNFDEENLEVISLASSISKYDKDSKVSLGVNYNFVRLNDISHLNIYGVAGSYKKNLIKDLDYTFSLEAEQKDYIQLLDSNRDSKKYKIKNILNLITKNYGANSFSFLLGQELRDRGQRTDISNRYLDLRITNRFPLNDTLLLNTSLDYKYIKYKYEDVNFLSKRRDEKVEVNLGIIKTISKSLSWGLTSNYSIQISNHEPFEYDKYSLKTNLYYSF